MLAKKNRAGRGNIFCLVLLGLMAGCTPPGPRALLEGKRLMDQGRNDEAVEKLRFAAHTLATNAQAWNYLGLACHRSGQVTNAVSAYGRALAIDHDLMESRYNLGCLWLEQNNLEAARANLTAYSLRRDKAPEGWLKLGAVELRARNFGGAEKHFRNALRLSPQDPEAWNGMGLVQVQLARPRDAAQCFAAALKQDPGYAPALLNLATVSHQFLNDQPAALQKYREYLALKPPPANADAVKVMVQTLERQAAPKTRPIQSNNLAQVPVSSPTVKTQPPPTPPLRAAAPRPDPPPAETRSPAGTPPLEPTNVEVVNLTPEPVIRTSPAAVSEIEPPAAGEADSSVTAAPPAVASSAAPAKRGFLQRVNPINIFRREKESVKPTPLPAEGGARAPGATTDAPPAVARASHGTNSASSLTVPRYAYLSPAKPVDGNRKEAERSFARGEEAQRNRRLLEAARAFRQATQSDPNYFEAHYSLGLVSFQSGNHRQALAAYEKALAIKPDSTDARYNFALVLKAAGYLRDAVAELEKIVTASPKETRAHLALGNLYAQQFRETDKAREHYLKVLDLDPQHPQATQIRFWLVANPA